MDEKGRAWIELSMENLRHNVKQLRNMLPVGCRLMPAVKADAYGHGAVLVTKELERLGIRDYCVASAAEGMELRKAGIRGRILVLGRTHPHDMDMLGEYRLIQTVADYEHGKELEAYGKELCVHVGIDTGMHRLGEPCENIVLLEKLWGIKNLHITGVLSHLCTSDGTTEAERKFMELQEARFLETVRALRSSVKKDFAIHLQGSYGILNGGRLKGRYDYARAGIALYGVLSEPSEKLEERFGLRPVLSLKARIGCVKKVAPGEGAGYALAWHAGSLGRTLAVVSAGYADGIPRTLSNRGYALVRGKKVPVAGRICMDQLLLDVTDVQDVHPGDEAVFIGQSEEQEISAGEMASLSGTITNELLSRMGRRLCRLPVRG